MQNELAQILGVKEMTVYNWKKGRTVPESENLKNVVDYFELKIGDMKKLA